MGWKANNTTWHPYQQQMLSRQPGIQEWTFLLLMGEVAWYLAGHNVCVDADNERVGPVKCVLCSQKMKPEVFQCDFYIWQCPGYSKEVKSLYSTPFFLLNSDKFSYTTCVTTFTTGKTKVGISHISRMDPHVPGVLLPSCILLRPISLLWLSKSSTFPNPNCFGINVSCTPDTFTFYFNIDFYICKMWMFSSI